MFVYQYIGNYTNHLIVIRKQSAAKLLYFYVFEREDRFIIIYYRYIKGSEQDMLK